MAAIQVTDSRQLLLCSNPDPQTGRVLNGSKKSRVVYTIPGLLNKDISSTTHLSIRLLHAEIPHSLYTVTSVNNLLRIIVGATTYDIEITYGNYSGDSLINFLQAWFDANASSLNMEITLSQIDGKLTFASTSSFSISGESTCGKLLGFDLGETSIYDSSLAKHVLICPNLLDLSGIKSIHIRCPSLSFSSFNTLTRVDDVLRSIPVSCEPFGVIMWNDSIGSDLVIKSIFQSNDLEIYMVDGSTGLELDFNGCDWLLTLEIRKHQFIQSTLAYLGSDGI
ncbi:hypothetical protein EON65_14770 [archaeon]|nr:MAG: hypothetical protein EON65_14770 [archaeon]